jgi:hypothetical protein
MGKDFTARYVVKLVTPGMSTTPYAWRVRRDGQSRGYGRPNDTNLANHVFDFARSLERGGVNEHLSDSLGFIPYPTKACIKDQFTGQVVATWEAASFQIWRFSDETTAA